MTSIYDRADADNACRCSTCMLCCIHSGDGNQCSLNVKLARQTFLSDRRVTAAAVSQTHSSASINDDITQGSLAPASAYSSTVK